MTGGIYASMVCWGTIMTLMVRAFPMNNSAHFNRRCMLQGLVKSYHGLMIARVFLGLAEGGLFPGIAFYITVRFFFPVRPGR